MRNSIDVVSSAVHRHDAAEALAVDGVDRRRRGRSCRRWRARPSASGRRHGVSSRCARQASAFSASAFGNVIVASMCRTVPRSPLLDLLAQLRHLRMEAAVVAETQRDAGLLRRRHRLLGLGLVQRERLLAEDVLAGLRGRNHLRARAASAASPGRRHRRSGPRGSPRSCPRTSAPVPWRTRGSRRTSCATSRRRTGSCRSSPARTRPASCPTSRGRLCCSDHVRS